MTSSPQILNQDSKNIPDRVCSYLEIDLVKIAHNYTILKNKLVGAQCGAVLKANAYGFGLQEVSQTLAQKGCQHFFVAHLEEGIALRQSLKTEKIYVFSGIIGNCAGEFFKHKLIPVINDFGMLKNWVSYAKTVQQSLPFILHVDTGMKRSGFDQEDLQKLLKEIELLDSLQLQFLMSHLCASQSCGDPLNERQRTQFEKIRSLLPHCPASLADTGGIYLGQKYHYQLTRPGKGLFGLYQSPENEGALANCINLMGRIVQVRKALKGESVGYGATDILERDSRLATIAVGFADGYNRNLSHKTFVEIAGNEAPIVGKISMDYTVIDVTDLPETCVYVGGWAEMINERLTLDSLAQKAGTISRELATLLGPRLYRLYKG